MTLRLPFACLAVSSVVFLAPLTARADAETEKEDEPPPRTHVAVEADPVTFALGGWSAMVLVRPSSLPRLRVGGVAYSANLPSFAVSEGWSAAKISVGGGLRAEYTFSKDGKGLWVGMLAGANHWKYTLENEGGIARTIELGVMPQIGYRWFPLKDLGAYITPWAGVGVPIARIGEPTTGGKKYEPNLPVAPFVAVHFGWEL